MNVAELPKLKNYEVKVRACWLGKAVGGTLGMPWEGCDRMLDLTYYNPVPTDMVPNDDLDLQVVWACTLDQMEMPYVSRNILADAWLNNVDFAMDEYGVAHRNMLEGIMPPLSGKYDNWFVHGMGAAIRSELWACLAAGNPKLAAAYAYEDACVDHSGEGIWAEVFLASLQAGAFIESKPKILIDNAVAQLPDSSLVKNAVCDTYRWWHEIRDLKTVREKILKSYWNENFTDVTMNMAFTVLGWLAGEGDFGKSICAAVNCGMDTDCTGATVGALMGIIDPTCIDKKWLQPIGEKLILSPEIQGLKAPADLNGLTDMVVRLHDRLGETYPQEVDDENQQAPEGFVVMRAGLEQDFAKLSNEYPDVPAKAFSPMQVPGTVGQIAADDITSPVTVLKFNATVHDTRMIKVMFNTPQRCKVWVDGKFAFSRDGGVMEPSFHRLPVNQFSVSELSKGSHEILAVVARPDNADKPIKWVVGLGDSRSSHWLPNTFR